MDLIRIYRTRKLGLEVFQVFYAGSMVSQFLSREVAWSCAIRLAKKLQTGIA